MRPSRQSAQDCTTGERPDKSGTRRPHRLFHTENDTPVLVQAALLSIELSKPTISPSTTHHQASEATRRIPPSQPLEPDFAYQRTWQPTLPGISPSPPASTLPSPPFFPAKLATADHTIPPPGTVQEPVTSAPYGGGQPPARTTNPPTVAAYPSPQTPPYSSPLAPPVQSNSSSQPLIQPYSQPPCRTQSQSPPYSQPQPQAQPDDPQSPSQAAAPYPQPQSPSYSQPLGQPLNPPQPRARSQIQAQPTGQPQPTYPPPASSPRLPFQNNRKSESSNRYSSTPQPYYPSPQRISSYPPAKPVLPMPKPPPHLLHILQQQEEQRKQQHFFLLQQQLLCVQSQQQGSAVLDDGQRCQPDAEHQRAPSSVESRMTCDRERESEDTEIQSNTDTTRTSIKQRPRLNKRIVTVSPQHTTTLTQGTPGQVSQPANSCQSTTATGANTNPNQRICTVPPHPYGTIIPRFSTQHAFNVSHHFPTNLPTQTNRAPMVYSSQPVPLRPDYLKNSLPGPTVARPVTSNFGTNSYQNAPSIPPEISTRHNICQTDPQMDDPHEYTPRSQPFLTKPEIEVRGEPILSPLPEPPHQAPKSNQQSPESTSQQPPQQTQGIQARLSHAQPLHSPALQTTHVMGSIQTIQSPPIKYQQNNEVKQDDYYSPVQPANCVQPTPFNRTSFSERSSGQSLLQQQQQSFQMQQWQQIQRQPSPQSYIQLGTFPPTMATFARPPSGTFVQNITDHPLKLSLPSQVQTTQLYAHNFSNVGVGIRSANSCPGDVRIGAFHPGLMHGQRPGSPHPARARSAGRVSVSESTASVWGSNSNPHHLP